MEEEGLPVMPPCCRPNMSGRAPLTLQQFLGQVHNPLFAKLWTIVRAVTLTHTQPACVQCFQAWLAHNLVQRPVSAEYTSRISLRICLLSLFHTSVSLARLLIPMFTASIIACV